MKYDKRINYEEHKILHKLFENKKNNVNYYENKRAEFILMRLYKENLISLSEFQTLKKFIVDTVNNVKGRSN